MGLVIFFLVMYGIAATAFSLAQWRESRMHLKWLNDDRDDHRYVLNELGWKRKRDGDLRELLARANELINQHRG